MRNSWILAGLVLAVTAVRPAAAVPIGSLDWRVVNDTVMGGVSQGEVSLDEAGDDAIVRFAGKLSLEQNGGFASVRAATPPGALAGAEALRVVLRGDGRTYALTLRRADVPLRAGSYRVPVTTEAGTSEHVVPLHAFRPTSFGRPVAGAPALDTALERVDTIGFMLSDGQPGPFALEILELSVVAGPPPAAADRGPLLAALGEAIAAGVPLFNRGQVAACRDTYAAALTAVLGDPGLTPGERSLVEEALADAANQSTTESAWTLRHAMDSLLQAGP